MDNVGMSTASLRARSVQPTDAALIGQKDLPDEVVNGIKADQADHDEVNGYNIVQ
jgi:hypothetical protein